MIRAAFAMLLLAMLGCGPAFAQAGFYLPTYSNNPGQDEFRAADGTTCRSTMDGAKRIELGSFATQGRTSDYGYGLSGYNAPSANNTGVYGRFSMSLDASPNRMDCNKLYRLEIERRELELEMMKRSLQSADRRLDEQMDQDGMMPTSSTRSAPAGTPAGSTAKGAKGAKAAAAPAKPRKVAATQQPSAAPPP